MPISTQTPPSLGHNDNPASNQLEDLLAFVKTFARQLAVLSLIGGIAGIVIGFMLPKQWEAQSVLQVGQIFWSSAQAPAVSIEEPARAVERLNFESTIDSVLQQLSLPVEPNVNSESDLIRRSAKAKLVRNTNFIEVSVRGRSPEDARRFLQTYQNTLIKTHHELWKPSISRLEGELREIQANLQQATARKERLQTLVDERIRHGSKANAADNIIISELATTIDNEVRQLRWRETGVQEQLNTQRSYNTRPVSDIMVSKRPVFPNKPLFAVGGVVAGFCLGMIWALLSDRVRRQATSA